MINNLNTVRRSVLYVLNFIPWQQLRDVQWKNEKATASEAYVPTPVEHLLNVLTHGVWIVPSVFATLKLFQRSHNWAQFLSSFVYGATLIFLFSVSTTFHCVFYCNKHRQLKDLLHRCDRAMIYIFIAGSYFPWLTVQAFPIESWASTMKWFVWLLALLGIIYQQAFHEKYKRLETFFYLVMGVVPALPIINEYEFSGMSELKLGGLLYVVGVIFFKSDGVIPCAHAIWHVFVVMAAGVHYFAILNYLYPSLPQVASVNIIKKAT